jgi:hypothetical protein
VFSLTTKTAVGRGSKVIKVRAAAPPEPMPKLDSATHAGSMSMPASAMACR